MKKRHTNPLFLTSFFYFLSFFLGFSYFVRAQTAQQFSTLAAEDFASYKKSEFTSKTWDDFVEEGFQAIDREDPLAALEFLRKAYHFGCRSPIVLFKMALAYEAQGAYYSAIQYYELAHEQFNKSQQKHRYQDMLDANYGRALWMMGQTARAIPVLERALKKDPNPWILRVMGDYYLKEKEYDQASTIFAQLLNHEQATLTPQEILIINLQLARIYVQKEQKKPARHYYEEVLVFDPNNEEAKKYLHETNIDESSWEKFLEFLD